MDTNTVSAMLKQDKQVLKNMMLANTGTGVLSGNSSIFTLKRATTRNCPLENVPTRQRHCD
ncbi:MAG TPA: hypothetical protein EYP59_16820 [Thiotrichaceae bacterium]|nr:hypothetical protein [Thiotrichaceae bacterium]